MRRAIAAGVVVFVAAFTAAVGGQADGQPRFRTGVELATFGVTVVDRRGNLVTDLTRDDFEVVEDGRAEELNYFAVGDGDTAPPLHVGLMLDASGSMQSDLKLAQGASIKFLNLLPHAEDITLVDFDTQVRITRYPQRDFPRLIERIRQRKPDGWTALYDALGTFLNGVDQQEGRRVLVMYTDGADSRSVLNLGETLTLLRASPVTVYAIGFVGSTGSSRQRLQMTLMQLTEVTGGQAFFPSSMKGVEDAYDRVLAEIGGQYHLGYVSDNTTTDGAWRKVEIRVKRPDTRVRARKGYFAPYKTSQN
ncbi:MAG: VWA domain-containing protein [Acidobacteriota bacterium]|nr:VWA domain-containing protein [Acidobacteriota bacterium]